MSFWDVLLKNLVLAHVLLPCITLAIILAVSLAVPRRRELARFIALQGALLSVACGFSILLRFSSQHPLPESTTFSQMITGEAWRPWPHAPTVYLAVGVDGLNLWHLVSLPCVTLSLLLWEAPRALWRPRDFCFLLGMVDGALLAFAARDMLLIAMGGAVSFVSLLLWIQPKADAPFKGSTGSLRGVILWGVVSGAAILFGTGLALVSLLQSQELKQVAEPLITTDIDAIAFETPNVARSFVPSQMAWRQQASGIFLAACIAALTCAGVWPLQEALVRSLSQMNNGPKIAMLCGLMPLGSYCTARILVPLLGDFIARAQGWIIGPLLLSLIWHLGLLCYSESSQDGPLRLTLASQLLAITGAMTGTVDGLCGAILVSLSAVWAYAAWLMFGNAPGSQVDSGRSSTVIQRLPPTAGHRCALALLAGCPGGGMFAGLWLISQGVLHGVQTRLISGVLLVGLIGLIWLLLAGNASYRSRREAVHEGSTRNRLWNGVGAAGLIAISLAAGILQARIVEKSSRNAQLISSLVAPVPVEEGQ